MHFRQIVLLISLSALCCNHSYAQSTNNLFELSLETLVNAKVVTASKRPEPLKNAPGVISVYSAADIRAFGARNIKDVLLRTPNFYMFDSSTFNATGSTMRAGATQHLNNHILYLINGRPLRESQNGGRHTDINLMFPISTIERIEIIRGPGSVLYGSNAFSGTVNIITKTPGSDIGGNITGMAGSYDYGQIGASGHVNTEQGVNLSASINQLSEGGAQISAVDDQLVEGSNVLSRDGYFALVDGRYKGFSAEAIMSEITLPSISGPFRWSGLSEFELSREYINVNYAHEFNKNWASSVFYTSNRSRMHIRGPRESIYLSDGFMYEVTVNGKLSDSTNLVFGIVNDHVQGDLGEGRGGRYGSERNNVYGQLDYRFNQKTTLTAGFQWNKTEEQTADTSPRFALVHKFNKDWTAKALFAEAFRSPFGSEIGFQSSFLQGDPDIKPETIETSEIQLIYIKPKLSITTTVYHSKSKDAIGRARIDGVTYFINVDEEINSNGIELEGRWSVTPRVQFQANASHQENKDSAGNRNVMLASNNMFKMGFSYKSKTGITASLWNSYFGAVSKLEDAPNSPVIVANPDAEAVNLLSFNALINVGQVFNSKSWENLELSVFADNLLNEEVWFPEMGQKSVNTFPQSHERGVYLRASLGF